MTTSVTTNNKNGDVHLLDASGRPMVMGNAHRGARYEREMMSWSPQLRSADADLLPDMKTLVARSYDLARNYPMASGGIQIHLDNIIGAGLRLSAKPDYRALGQDAEWAAEWSRRYVEPKFRLWSEDPGCYIDAARRLTMASMLGLGYRQFLMAGDILGTAEWLPGRGNRYSTAIQMVEPARLSNPVGRFDSNRLRAGVDLDRMGAARGYHIRSAMQSDSRFAGAETQTWKRVPRETPWGRTQVIHIFEQERAGQTRGKTGLATIIANSFKLGKFQDISMEAATVNSMFAATIETEFNYAQAAEVMGNDDAIKVADGLIDAMGDFHSAKTVKMDGVKVPHLYPGERLNMSSVNHPGPNFAEFEKSFLRNQAAGWNLTYEQLARDYSETNYSGARAGLQEVWKFFNGRRQLIGGRFASSIYELWLEEAIDKGDVPLPPGGPDFYEAKAAYCRSRWIGPAKGQIDPLKENKSDDLEMDMGTLTLEDACAARGKDWEENLEQISREKKRMSELGLNRADIRGYQTPEQPLQE
ncbi:phage portal protein [Candidatus Vondammii sp. HM_W22]|uniref:phage portal protein n=1 Tax=Candidatus Vondammii sp. HM_W22 TaxID=2687299 RepID=UPI002E7AED6A|nr:phage portal protein [Candidatus Vondammii sp. HM_W22]